MQNVVSSTLTHEIRDWSMVTIETDPCIGVTRRALKDMMDKIKVEVNRLSKSGMLESFLKVQNQHFLITINDRDVFFSYGFYPTELKRIEKYTGKVVFLTEMNICAKSAAFGLTL